MCGILGVLGPEPVAPHILNGLVALQHRGQDAAGIATFTSRLHIRKRFGLVRDRFGPNDVAALPGPLGIGHVRYPTVGLGDVGDAQPLFVNWPHGIAMAHNGNVTNFSALRSDLRTHEHRQINTQCDVEVILNVFAAGLGRHAEEGFADACAMATRFVFQRVRGSYSAVAAVSQRGLVAIRDPYGIKPLVYGRRGGMHVVASESCALDALDADVVRDLSPGEVLVVDLDGNTHSRQVVPPRHHPCIFEYIYFARPDSLIDDISVYKTRLRLGLHLADLVRARGLAPDVVIPVPDSARPAAQAVAEELGVKLREGLLKNRYIGRTFIMPSQSERRRSVRQKLSPLHLEIEGKKVLIVDDSIVRGTTMRGLIQMVRGAGAREVYVASSCPPIRHPCVYGIDMSVRGEFIAAGRDEKEIEESLDADALVYARIPEMIQAAGVGNPRIQTFCKACMDGEYPTGDVTPETLAEIESERLTAYREIEKA
ncbi:MAG: amidophosphoribosyltransferase [Planctomycetota bacterium]|jgi:amidophosphoribosyltransferase